MWVRFAVIPDWCSPCSPCPNTLERINGFHDRQYEYIYVYIYILINHPNHPRKCEEIGKTKNWPKIKFQQLPGIFIQFLIIHTHNGRSTTSTRANNVSWKLECSSLFRTTRPQTNTKFIWWSTSSPFQTLRRMDGHLELANRFLWVCTGSHLKGELEKCEEAFEKRIKQFKFKTF